MKRLRSLAAGCATLALGATGLLGAPAAHAATLPGPDAVYQAWNDNFLVQANGDTYYTNQLKSKGTTRAGMWIAALDIQVAQDVYERTHAAADRQRVIDLVNTYIKYEGTTWESWDGWNDDIAWDITTVLRGYQQTGNTTWLNVAIDQFDKTYDKGWTGDGGGGIWENDTYYSKCSLSNNPMVSIAANLYRITGDGAYLTKAEQIYDWARSHLVDSSSGVVNECVAFPNGKGGATVLQASDNAYNAGSWIEAADNLYRVTGNTSYRDDAQRTADHFLNTVPIVANNQTAGSSYQYWLFKGISDFCTDANLCGRYDSWMRSNAAQAWSVRNSADLTWNDWSRPTNDPNPDAFEMNGMVGLFQVLPNTAGSPFSGDYQIKNASSGLSLAVQGASTANSAPVVQNNDTTDGSASWSFVPQSNGYYEIRNTHSGQLLNVTAASGKPGALVVQWPAGGIASGNDQWKPVHNPDGTWSFYNRSSKLALDNPGAGAARGTQYEQWAPNDTGGQRFTLLSRTGGGTPSSGSGPVRSGLAGKCLDLNAGNPANGTKVEIWSCNGGAAQSWTAPSSTLQISGKCLDATGTGTANGTLVGIWECNGGGNQVWQPYNGGYRNPASGRCLDDPAASGTDGTQLELWDCNGTAAQIWSLPGA
ncbi:RICIN domain-containing protein [Kitasatospora sp. NBC_00315]|uniref:RICIN domain-containing protein n=1 Tax=Kitasatospora sp. NBC_00315 TaxID=2975963 RepID=UPI00352E9A34